jgi:hypothetical protein
MAAALAAAQLQVVDVEAVRATGDPAAFVRTLGLAPDPVDHAGCDILVAGAGTGGVAAALQAAGRGHTVCLTEETSWIGGQITAGGVSALDENRFIEISGGTRNYQEMRRRIRDYYRRNYRLSREASTEEYLNPGACYVSPLCFEPKAGLQVLEEMLAPHSSRIRLLLRSKVVALDVHEGVIRSALVYRFDECKFVKALPRFVLDATETGELLPLAGVPFVAGSEAKSETGEPHAAAEANSGCVQSFTYPFAIDVRPGENHRVAKPPEYEKFRDGQPFSLRIHYNTEFGWKGDVSYRMFGDDPPVPNNMSPGPFLAWRRLLAARNFAGPNPPGDLALINWPRQDYHSESLLDRTPLDTARVLQQAKRVSLAFLYWLQTDLPRDDGKGHGYPELRLRPDVMGTEDGLSRTPYIREARRIVGEGRVVEQDIVAEYQTGARARWFGDSIGTGFYMVDIHPCGANERGRMMMPRPFQIPLGTLIPKKVSNLLAAGKNIGVTHLTNGAFRLHPIEWNVGEAAAVLASLQLRNGARPPVAEVQKELAEAGVQMVWFDDLPVDDPSFAAIQLAALRGFYPLADDHLHANPDAPVTRAEAAWTLSQWLGRKLPASVAPRLDVPPAHPRAASIHIAIEEGWMAVDHRNWFHPDVPFYWADWREDRIGRRLPRAPGRRSGPVRRREMAERLTG